MNPAIKNVIRPHYLQFDGYVSAGMESGKDESRIFMNANENPFELPGLEGFNRYPEPQPAALREAYAQAYDVDSDQIVMTRGADEAIVILTKLFIEPHKDKILICPPSFGMYKVNADSMPGGTVDVPLLKKDGTFALDVEGIIKGADKAKMIFICSPNNPTATSFPQEEILEICNAVEGKSVVILDETYTEFSEAGSMTKFLDSAPNLIILRTLSKSYAFAGMRMGCFIAGDRDFINLARKKCLDAYPLPRASIEAAFHVLSPEISAIAIHNIRTLIAERKRLETALAQSKLVRHIYPSDANFLLVEMDRAKEFLDYCAAQNIILRDFTTKPMTADCLRISVGLPEHNDAVITLLTSFETQPVAAAKA
jgi:histidinol-phosphate aminotransferase